MKAPAVGGCGSRRVDELVGAEVSELIGAGVGELDGAGDDEVWMISRCERRRSCRQGEHGRGPDASLPWRFSLPSEWDFTNVEVALETDFSPHLRDILLRWPVQQEQSPAPALVHSVGTNPGVP